MQVGPIKPEWKVPGTKRLNLKYDELPSNIAFKFNLRRYNKARTVDGGTPLHIAAELGHVVGCCTLNPALKPPVSSP